FALPGAPRPLRTAAVPSGPLFATTRTTPPAPCRLRAGRRIRFSSASALHSTHFWREDTHMAKPIAIEHVFKVFGDAPQAALDLVRQGCSKQEILERTGQSIGVFDAHFRIEAGEIFVVMGLSGSGKS